MNPTTHTLVILGTGTDVGKTYFTRSLALELRRARPNALVTALKPIESGFSRFEGSDAEQLASASSLAPPSPHPLYALPEPVSPHLAARLAGRPPIEVPAITAWLDSWKRALAASVAADSEHWCLIETAGALFSPLSASLTNYDLARALDPALWILLAPDSLGVLHDVRTTLEALQSRGRLPELLVLSAARAADASTGTNAAELRTLGIADPALALSRNAQALSPLVERIVGLAKRKT